MGRPLLGRRRLLLQRGNGAGVVRLHGGDLCRLGGDGLRRADPIIVLVHRDCTGGDQGDRQGDDAGDLGSRAGEQGEEGHHPPPGCCPADSAWIVLSFCIDPRELPSHHDTTVEHCAIRPPIRIFAQSSAPAGIGTSRMIVPSAASMASTTRETAICPR